MKNLQSRIRKIADFLTKDIWTIQGETANPIKSFYVRYLKIFIIAVKGFNEDNCVLRASALTFYSLLSVVPVLAMAFGIAQGFGFRKAWAEWLRQNLGAQQEALEEIIIFVDNLLASVNGGIVAGAGLIFLVWTVIQLLNNIEDSLNSVWEVRKARTWERKFTDYLVIVFFAPVIIFISSGITVFVTGQIESLTALLQIDRYVQPVVEFIAQLIPYALIWLLLTLVYMVLPNLRVRFQSALAAGILAGALYQIAQWAYITFQIGVSRYGAIYTTFAALPLFMVWLQVSWFIFLFGAEISFAHQNVDRYTIEKEKISLSIAEKKLLALLIVQKIVKTFATGGRPFTAARLSEDLGMPVNYTNHILANLVNSGVLCETVPAEKDEPGYLPCQDIDRYTVHFILAKVEAEGASEKPFMNTAQLDRFRKILQGFEEIVSGSPGNKKLRDL